MKKIIRTFLLCFGLLMIVAAIGFIWWAETPSRPAEAALAALQSDQLVNVIDRGDYIYFEPIGNRSDTALLFYPGGHVDFRAYAPILHQIASEGYPVALVRVDLNLAIFDINAGKLPLAELPESLTWITAGHSLGGVAAAYFAADHPEVKGIVFWASYPADDRLLQTNIKMMSIYGSEDGGLDDGAKIEKYKAYQTVDTEYVLIQGANHGQFGDYGPQPGDNPATITAEEQWRQVTNATVRFLNSFPK